jgi:hypothetical protein
MSNSLSFNGVNCSAPLWSLADVARDIEEAKWRLPLPKVPSLAMEILQRNLRDALFTTIRSLALASSNATVADGFGIASLDAAAVTKSLHRESEEHQQQRSD